MEFGDRLTITDDESSAGVIDENDTDWTTSETQARKRGE